MDEQQFVNITAYDTELLSIISVPAHYSEEEICEAIWAEMKEYAPNHATRQSLWLLVSFEITYFTNPNGQRWQRKQDKCYDCIRRRLAHCNHLREYGFGDSGLM